MKHVLRPLPLVLAVLVTACATAPVPTTQAPGIQPPSTSVSGIGAGKMATSLAPVVPVDTHVWERLRASFAMADCAADPQIESWAHRYTRSPQRFENEMRAVLPRLVYVQEIAAHHGVPGEFALLPWVESHFKPLPPRANRPAGMWQIVPGTARHMGLAVERDYDARLDLTASTDAVMGALSHYHDWFQDWRLADYAYNAGKFSIDRLVTREGAPPAEPAVPALPVSAGTRQHLVKLLAIACVVREPERFHVTLPTLDADQHLVSVDIPERLSLAKAARQAGMPLAALADLNAGYRRGVVDGGAGRHLVLPSRHAEQLRTALLAQAVGPRSEQVASVGTPSALPELAADNQSTAPRGEHVPAPPTPEHAAPRVHVVRSGDTLSSLARRFHVRVAQLKRWNALRGNDIRIGQKLTISAPD